MLCPELVGRDVETATLRTRVDDLAGGGGGVVVLRGEAGAGKSRLAEVATKIAAGLGYRVLAGRAVPGASPVPYRPLTEAFLTSMRGVALPDDAALTGFRPHLGRLVPEWRSGAGEASEESPVLLGEAIVRLLALLGPALLVVEDLHWADAETLEVIDYLVEALRAEPVLCVCTARPGGASTDLLSRLARRDPDTVVRVGDLGERDVDRMLAACLDTATPPADVGAFLRRHSDGSPFLVEELLAGLVASGELRLDDGSWVTAGHLRPTVPASLRDSIARRLGALDATSRRVLGAAALLGRRFEWELLPGIAEVDGRAVVDALRAGVDEQLIEVEGSGFAFRHALTREAIVHDLLPPEQRDLAARAWPAIERANPGLPGPVLELAADLAEAAGETTVAAERLVESARRALAAAAFATAEATARRAQQLAAGDQAVALNADEVLVDVLATAGKPGESLVLGRDLAARLGAAEASPERQVDLLVGLVRAAVAAGDLDAGAAAEEEARVAAGIDPDAVLRARIDAVASAVALDRGDVAIAETLSRRAVDDARATAQPAVECEALLVLGRAIRPKDALDARRVFADAAQVASSAGLPRWHLRAQQELALEEWVERGAPAMEEMRALAVRYGAHLTVAVMDLSLADVAFSCYDRDTTLRHATACVDASRRYGLATESVANLWLAGAHVLAGDDEGMQAAIDASLAKDPDDPRILGDLFGRVLATRAFVRDELESLRELFEQMMEQVHRAPPHTSIFPGRLHWVLLCTIDDDDLGAPARAEMADLGARIGMPQFTHTVEMAEGIALGRAGDAAGAQALVDAAYDELIARMLNTGMMHATSLLVARAATRDGWGDPARFLRDAEAFFTAAGYDKLARRSRTMLAEAGAPVPRRRGDTEVPQALRALGVTGREVDVLKLVVGGLSNKEIAAELVLSPKTVERHLSSLFTRLGVANRRELADVGGAHLR